MCKVPQEASRRVSCAGRLPPIHDSGALCNLHTYVRKSGRAALRLCISRRIVVASVSQVVIHVRSKGRECPKSPNAPCASLSFCTSSLFQQPDTTVKALPGTKLRCIVVYVHGSPFLPFLLRNVWTPISRTRPSLKYLLRGLIQSLVQSRSWHSRLSLQFLHQGIHRVQQPSCCSYLLRGRVRFFF